jgi:hypothetical protein
MSLPVTMRRTRTRVDAATVGTKSRSKTNNNNNNDDTTTAAALPSMNNTNNIKSLTSVAFASILRMAVLILTFAVSLFYLIPHHSTLSPSTSPTPTPTIPLPTSSSVVQPIERIKWSSEYGELTHFFTSGPRPRPKTGTGSALPVNDLLGVRPIILTNTIADDWPARTLWTPSYLSKKIGNVRLSKVLSSNVTSQFLYANTDNPLATSTSEDGYVWYGPPYAVNQNMPATHFFKTLLNGPGYGS